MSVSRCKNCGRMIEWVQVEGRNIPLETKPATYIFNGTAYVRSAASVDHIAICPNKQQLTEEKSDVKGKWYERD